MRSINNDIRVRSRNLGRTVAIIVGVAALALSLSFGLSFLPAIVSAHVATTLPTWEHVGQPIYVTVQADVQPGETVQAIAWAFGDLNVQPVTFNCANSGNSIFVPFTNTDILATTTGYGVLEFSATAPSTAGNYSFFYQVSTSTDSCSDIMFPFIENDHALDTVPPYTTTSQTIVVRAADLAADIAAVIATPTKWFFYNDETDVIDNTLGLFVLGPSTAALGSGSAEMTVLGTQRRNIATYQFKSIKLSQITALSFSTYSQSTTTTTRAPYLNFNVSFDGADTWQRRLAFVPNLNGSVVANSWQSWDAANPSGLWVYSGSYWPAGTVTVANTVTGSTARSLSSLLTDYPNIQTRSSDSWFGFRVGEPYADGFTGNVDNFVITTDDGINATTTTFDFEPTVVVAPTCDGSTTFDAFTLGSVNSQGGWGVTGGYDQAVVSNTYGFTTFGCQTLRISNAVTTGAFGDQTFSPSVTNEAGEADSTNNGMSGGLRQPHYEAQFDFASAQLAQQPGLFLSVSPDRGDGSRMSYLGFEDAAGGINVTFYDVQSTGTPANFVPTTVATNLSRTTAHTAKFVIDYIDGASNDIVKIYIDGILVHTGTTWENYYRFDVESAAEQTPRTSDDLIFRAGGTAAPLTSGKGFLIDNVAVSTSGNTPVVTPPSSTGGSNPGNGGGVIGGPNGFGFVNTNNGGQVLGTSTEALPAGCELYISGYLKKGSSNVAQVKKLQTFLNTFMNAGLPVTGVFGALTFEAVKAFQVKHFDEVLAPWVKFGLESDHTATGYVYKTTQRMINLVQCNHSIIIPAPQLP